MWQAQTEKECVDDGDRYEFECKKISFCLNIDNVGHYVDIGNTNHVSKSFLLENFSIFD